MTAGHYKSLWGWEDGKQRTGYIYEKNKIKLDFYLIP